MLFPTRCQVLFGAVPWPPIRPFGGAFRGGLAVSTARLNLDSVPDIIAAFRVPGGGVIAAYGGTARPGIPANSTLVFDVELLSTT